MSFQYKIFIKIKSQKFFKLLTLLLFLIFYVNIRYDFNDNLTKLGYYISKGLGTEKGEI